ncbi:MAG: hypothetical protein HY702_05990 [Gemmatimonadetes bacterium]|nr:hypothetical protein [Gemmatimonadota bacterium]
MPPGGLWARVREARLVRVLLLYLAASWLVLQVVSLLQDRLQLPEWLTPVAVALLLVGLVVVLATAWVQARPATRTKAEEVPAAWEVDLGGLLRSLAKRRLPHLTWARAILGGVVAFSLLFGASGIYLYLKGRGAAISIVEEATAAPGPGIAVLPFRVVGPGLELWREGMVDLLSTNLDGAVGLRKIDPRAIVSRWRSAFGEGAEASDPQAALGVARAAAASYALLGSAVALAGEVRLTAEVYDVATGKLQGTALVEGSPDSVFALVNRLSIEVLRAGLAREPAQLPQLELSRVTTTSLPALKAYLAGQQQYRRNRWTEAIPHYMRAVEADSTFALALYGLGRAYGWLEGPSQRMVEYGQRAARLGHRLPERERLLLRGTTELDQGRTSGVQTFEELTSRYPDDVEGWHQLGEILYHHGDNGLYPRDGFRNAFRRALEMDPNFGPSYIHLIDDAFLREDSSEARELIERYRGVDPTGPWPIGYQLAYALAWGDSAARSAAIAAVDTAAPDVLEGARFPFFRGPSAFAEQLMLVSRRLLAPRHAVEHRQSGQWGMMMAAVRQGRLREARAVLSAFPGGELFSVTASRLYIVWHLAGYNDTIAARRAAGVLGADPQPWDRFLLAAFAAAEPRSAEVEEQIRALEADAERSRLEKDSVGAADRRAFAQAARGYAALRGGDRREAVRRLKEAHPRLPGTGPLLIRASIHELLRYELGKLLFELGDFQEAARYFRSLEVYSYNFSAAHTTPVEFFLGEVYQALGDLEEAKLHYGRFVHSWENCDPELRPWWERGRQALARLTRETATR